MATISLEDWVLDSAGAGVASTVSLFAVNGDGTIGAQIGSDIVTASGSFPSGGRYSFTNVTLPASGKVAVRTAAGADVRWRYPGRFQLTRIEGPNGDAPLADASVNWAQLKTAPDASTGDAKIGSRTVDQATAVAFGNSGTLTQLLSWFAKALKAVTGEANWYTTPLTGTLRDKVRNGGNAPRLSRAVSLGSPAETGEIKVVTSGSNKGVWAATTASAYTQVADLGGTSTVSSANGFANIVVGGTTIAAEQAEDTLTLVAGTNVTLTASATGDSITISAASGGTSGTNATTLNGVDGNQFPFIASMVAGSPSAPSLTSGVFKMRVGSEQIGFSGSGYTIGIPDQVNGIVTTLITDGDYEAHPAGVSFAASTSATGNPGAVQVKAYYGNGAAYGTGVVRLNYLILYW